MRLNITNPLAPHRRTVAHARRRWASNYLARLRADALGWHESTCFYIQPSGLDHYNPAHVCQIAIPVRQ